MTKPMELTAEEYWALAWLVEGAYRPIYLDDPEDRLRILKNMVLKGLLDVGFDPTPAGIAALEAHDD